MKAKLIFALLPLLLLTGCQTSIPSPAGSEQIKASEKEPEQESVLPSVKEEVPTEAKPSAEPSIPKDEESSLPKPETITVYYFQIYLDNVGDRYPYDVDYRFSLTFPYGEKFGSAIYAEDEVVKYPPKYSYGDGVAQRKYYTSLDPLYLDSARLETAMEDRILYFAPVN